MTPEILTVNTPLGADPEKGEIPFDLILADLDGDGVEERVEIETVPRIDGSPFREWRVLREDRKLIGVAAGVDVSVQQTESGLPVLVSDGAFWRGTHLGAVMPYGDLVLSRSDYMVMGTERDRQLLDENGSPGIFRQNVRTIPVQLSPGRGAHRVIAGGGFAFMDPETDTAAFVISDPEDRPVILGRSGGHPWLFRREGGFTLISDNAFGFQISLIPEGFF